MNFDSLTALAVRRQLTTALLDGRVQRTILPDQSSLGLEIYANGAAHQLLLCAEPGRARAHLVESKLKRGVDGPSPLLLLLRKYVRGSRLTRIHQPPLERILTFEFSYYLSDSDETGSVTLILETIGRQSNLILIDSAGRIMDSHRRVGPGMSRYRQIVPHLDYVSPPPVARPPPADLTPTDLQVLATAKPTDPAWRILLDAAAGVSPLLARECVHRAGLPPLHPAAEVADWDPPLAALQDIVAAVESGPPQAWIALLDGLPAAYAPYELTHYADREMRPSISVAITEFVSASGAPTLVADSDLRRALRRRLAEARRRAGAKLVALRRSADQGREADLLRESGELLLAHQTEIPPGASEIELNSIAIALNPRLTPVQNAGAYFKSYKSARTAAERTPLRLRKVELDLEFIEQTELDLTLAATDPELRAIEEVLAKTTTDAVPAKRSRRRRRSAAAPPGPREFDLDGFTVLVGRNATQNHAITFRRALPDDLWLHARGIPGAHVILRLAGQVVPDSILTAAAGIAAFYSRAAADRHVEVDVTARKNVRPIRGAGPGQVTYRQERTFRVPPYDPESTPDSG
jgi:predicted ribosome quality control (RQC) complex YloA/Tae2 family protein